MPRPRVYQRREKRKAPKPESLTEDIGAYTLTLRYTSWFLNMEHPYRAKMRTEMRWVVQVRVRSPMTIDNYVPVRKREDGMPMSKALCGMTPWLRRADALKCYEEKQRELAIELAATMLDL